MLVIIGVCSLSTTNLLAPQKHQRTIGYQLRTIFSEKFVNYNKKIISLPQKRGGMFICIKLIKI